MDQSSSRYSGLIISLHWLTLGLLILTYISMESRSLFERGSDARELVKALHYSLGVTVLLIIGLRIMARLMNKAPAITPPLTAVGQRLAAIGHLAIYLWLLLMPVLGALTLSFEGHEFSFWGVPLPLFTGLDTELAKQIEDIHKWLADAGYYLIGGHALAAIWHHHGRKDNTLYRMLPLKHLKPKDPA